MLCDDDSKTCAYGECTACKIKKFNFDPSADAVVTRPITYTQLKLKKVPRVKTDDENAQSWHHEQTLLLTPVKKEVTVYKLVFTYVLVQ